MISNAGRLFYSAYRKTKSTAKIRPGGVFIYSGKLSVEVVAEALAGNDVAGISAQLLSHSGNIYIDGTVYHDDIVRPNLIDYFLSAEQMAFIAEQEVQYLELGFGKGDLFAIDIYGFVVDVQHKVFVS